MSTTPDSTASASTFATVLVAIGSLLVGVVLIVLVSDAPALSVRAFLLGPFDGTFQIGTTLARSIPYMFTGLAVAVGFRAAVFNIGAEGQLYLGALAGTAVALQVSLPGPLLIVAALLAAAVAGGLYGFVPGILRAVWGTNEVVTTLMLNFVAILLTSFVIAGPLLDPDGLGFPQTAFVPDTARLPQLLPPSKLNLGLVLAVAACIAVHLLLSRTTFGYDIRIAGDNPEFLRYGGRSPTRAIAGALTLGGALAGLAGIAVVLGDQGRLIDGFSTGYGFVGILIALLAGNRPLAVPIAALFYAYLASGAAVMENVTDVPREVVTVVQGTLFLFVTVQVLNNVRSPRDREPAQPVPLNQRVP